MGYQIQKNEEAWRAFVVAQMLRLANMRFWNFQIALVIFGLYLNLVGPSSSRPDCPALCRNGVGLPSV